jgi:hypothetical protein
MVCANAQQAKAASNQARSMRNITTPLKNGQPNDLPNDRTLQRRLDRCCSTRAWLTARPSTLERTELSCQEWRDGDYLQYGMTPQGLPAICDGKPSQFHQPCPQLPL